MQQTTHCQICARDIKARTGVIAHHGYQRPGNGWQTSSCLGARYPSYEESNKRIPEVQEIYKGMLTHNKERLEEVLTNPPNEITESFNYSYRTPETYTRPVDFDKAKAIAQGAFSHNERYAMEYRRLVKAIQNNITGLTGEVEYLGKRYKEWNAA